MTTTTNTAELEDIAIVVDLVRGFHSSGKSDNFELELAGELGALRPETISALADALTTNVPIIVTPQ